MWRQGFRTANKSFKYYFKCRRADIFNRESCSGQRLGKSSFGPDRRRGRPLQMTSFFRRSKRLALQSQLSRGPRTPVNVVENQVRAS